MTTGDDFDMQVHARCELQSISVDQTQMLKAGVNRSLCRAVSPNT